MTRHLWVEKSRQAPSHLRCARVLNKRSAAQKANSNTVVSGRVLNKAKKPRSVTHTHTHIYIYTGKSDPPGCNSAQHRSEETAGLYNTVERVEPWNWLRLHPRHCLRCFPLAGRKRLAIAYALIRSRPSRSVPFCMRWLPISECSLMNIQVSLVSSPPLQTANWEITDLI